MPTKARMTGGSVLRSRLAGGWVRVMSSIIMVGPSTCPSETPLAAALSPSR